MRTIFTVRAADLLKQADQIERDANQSLKAWVILGQTERYGDAMRSARAMRSAAAAKSVWERREILRNSGFKLQNLRA